MDAVQIIIHSKNFLKPHFVTVKVTVEFVEIVTSSLSEEKNTKLETHGNYVSVRSGNFHAA